MPAPKPSLFRPPTHVFMFGPPRAHSSEHNWALAGPGKSAHTPNWEMTQWAGLAKSAVAFPELANSSAFLELALDELESLMDSEVYPDGVET